MTSTVFRQFQAFILKNERERSHHVSGWLGASRVLHAQQLGADISSRSPIEKATGRLKYYRLFIVKTT
jgi:hypothetical protein